MAIDKETRILKSNTIDQLRTKTNEVSLNLGDTDQLDALIGDKIYDYANVAVGTNVLQGSSDSTAVQKFNIKPDETIDNTGGYIILTGNPSIPSGFTANATVTQSGGFSATIVVANSEKILVKNTSGTFNAAQNLTVGSDNIANSAVLRLISESYSVGNIRVFKNGTELTQDLTASGFHVPTLSGAITLTGNPTLTGFEEGQAISQTGGFTGTVLKASSTLLLLKNQSGSYNAGQNITNGLGQTIAAAKHTGIVSKDIAFGNAIELNSKTTANTDDIKIKATSTVDALNEIQQDVGNIASLGTTDKTDIVSAINELETAAKGTQANYSVTAGTDFKSAINTLDAEIGTVADLNNADGYTQQVLVPSITEIQGKIGEVTAANMGTTASTIVTAIEEHEDQIGDVNINSIASGNNTITGALTQLHTEVGTLSLNTAATNLTAAINEIEGVFDASTKEISAGSSAFNVTSGTFTIDSAGDVILDSNSGNITLKAGGTQFGEIDKVSGTNNILIKSGSTTMLTGSGANATFAGNINLPDNGKALFGASSDLQIYHDGSDSYIKDGGTGNLIIAADDFRVTNVAVSEVMISADTDGAVSLYHNGNSKLATTTGGVLVTGELEATTLDINGAGDISGALNVVGNLDVGGILDIGQLNDKFTNRNNVKSALNELHDEMGVGGNAFSSLANHSTNGLTNITSALLAVVADLGPVNVSNGITHNGGNHAHKGSTIHGVLENISDAVVSNDGEISTLNTFKTNIEARTITGGDGLKNGGSLAANRTIDIDLVNNTATGTSGLQTDSGKLKVNNTVVRTSGTQSITGSVTFDSSSSVTISGTLTVGSASGISTFGSNLISTDGSGAEQGLQVKNNTVHSGYTIDPKVIWNHAKVAAQPQRAWQLVGLAADGSTAQTSDILTFNNYGDILTGLVANNVETGISVTADTTNKNLDFAIRVDDSTIEVNGSNNLQVKNLSIARGKIANDAIDGTKIADDAINSEHLVDGSVDNIHLAGSITNGKLQNSSITIGNSAIALGGSDTTLTGLTDIDLTSGNKTIFDGVGANDLTIGASNTHVKIAGNFTVEGTTTTLNTANLDVADLNIKVAKNATTSANANTSGLTFGNYGAAATLTYSHSGTKLVSNKPLQATSFIGNTSSATILETARSFQISGDITANAITFNGSGGVNLVASIDANTVDVAELNVTGSPGDGKAITYQSGGLQWATLSTTDTNTKYGISVVDGDIAAEEKIRLTSTGSDAGVTDDVVLAASTGLTIARSGDKITYTNSAPDQTVALTGAGATTITGTYPNFTITSTDTNDQLNDAQVRSKFTAGEGIDISGSGEISGEDATTTNKGIAKFNTADFAVSSGDVTIKALGVSNAQLAGSIATSKLAGSITNAKLSNSSITVTGGNGLSNGGSVSLGGSVTLAVNVDDSSIEINSDSLRVKAGGITNDMLAGSIANGKLTNSSVSFGGVSVSLGSSDATPAFDLQHSTGYPTTQLVGTITNAQLGGSINQSKLAGSIPNSKLANSSISGVSLGGQLLELSVDNSTLQLNSGTTYNGSATKTISIKDGGVAAAKLHTNNVTNATVSGSTLTLTRQGASNVVHGPFDNYGSWSISDGSSSSAVTAGNTVQLNGTSGQISTTRSGDNITFALDHNYVGGIEHKNSGGASQGTGDIGSKGGRLVFKEGTNMSFSLSGTELTINGPAINNAGNLTTGTLAAARLPSTIDTTLQIGNGNDTSIQFDQDTRMVFDIDNTDEMILAGSTLHVNGDMIAFSTTTSSDIKLKENIQKVEGALELVSQLNGVTFDWKDKERGSSAGVIAQNVEEVLPSAVTEVDTMNSEDTHKVVNYNQLSALFIEAIKELKEQNKELKDEIEVLKNINSNS